MANQYTDSLFHVAPKKFGKSAEELLREFAKDDKNYTEVAKITGFKKGTIRKWCQHYNITLKSLVSPKDKEVDGIDKINLKSKEVDVTNFLYRKWQPAIIVQ